jgi:hypothetical protein
MCDSCSRSVLSGSGRPLQQFLDALDAPLLVVDSDLVVLAGNRRAQEALKKDLPRIKRRCGDVIGCQHAGSSEGCGGTVHCKSCTIRRTVLDTYATGKSHLGVDAYPDVEVDSKVKHLRIRISTEKLGDVVLLRIDERD